MRPLVGPLVAHQGPVLVFPTLKKFFTNNFTEKLATVADAVRLFRCRVTNSGPCTCAIGTSERLKLSFC